MLYPGADGWGNVNVLKWYADDADLGGSAQMFYLIWSNLHLRRSAFHFSTLTPMFWRMSTHEENLR
jgi:hypothetical protein